MLEARSITFQYDGAGEPLLREISVAVAPGDFTMLLGPNGCGKSTVLKLLAGFLAVRSGEVCLDGSDLQRLPPRERARRIGVVPQEIPPVLDFTVEEMVMMGRNPRLPRLAPPGPEDLAIVRDMLERLELAPLARRPCNRLSGGERQRVLIAAALALEPDYLLLDEPTSALDPAHALRLPGILRSLPHMPGCLLTTHNLQLAARFARRIILMENGRLRAAGTPRDVLLPENIRAVYHCDAEILTDRSGGIVPSLRSMDDYMEQK